MTRRKWLAWLLLLALVALGGTYGVLWLTTPPPGVTQENVRRLRAGMSLEDVERLFGHTCESQGITDTGSHSYFWDSESDFTVAVVFDEAGLLKSALLISCSRGYSHINVNESLLDWLRRMLRL